MLASGQTSPQSTNTKNYKGLKIAACLCVCAVGQITDKIKKRPKTPQLPLLKSKNGVGSKSRVLHMPSAQNTTKGLGKQPKSLFQPDPWTHPYLHPMSGTSSPLLRERASKQGKLLFVLASLPAAVSAPNIALPGKKKKKKNTKKHDLALRIIKSTPSR